MNKLFSTLHSTLFAIKDFQMQQTYQKKVLEQTVTHLHKRKKKTAQKVTYSSPPSNDDESQLIASGAAGSERPLF